jgi:hypothetical protein
MNKQEKAAIAEMRIKTKKGGVNRYRFAWWLMKAYPHLVVAIIRKYLSELEKK